MCNKRIELDRSEMLSLKKKREVRFHRQRESDRQWQDAETEDKALPARETGEVNCFGPFHIWLMTSHYLRASHVNWDFPGILFS